MTPQVEDRFWPPRAESAQVTTKDGAGGQQKHKLRFDATKKLSQCKMSRVRKRTNQGASLGGDKQPPADPSKQRSHHPTAQAFTSSSLQRKVKTADFLMLYSSPNQPNTAVPHRGGNRQGTTKRARPKYVQVHNSTPPLHPFSETNHTQTCHTKSNRHGLTAISSRGVHDVALFTRCSDACVLTQKA